MRLTVINFIKSTLRKKIVDEVKDLPSFTYPECCKLTNEVILTNVLKAIRGKDE
jgi:hypothetical protein